jgi:hypothetical protein
MIVMCAVVSLGACSKAKDEHVPAAKPVADPAIAVSAPEAANKTFADLFSGPSVALPAIVANVRFGMTRDEAKAAAPEVVAQDTFYTLPDFRDVEVMIYFQDPSKRVNQIHAKIDQLVDKVKQVLTTKWGSPAAVGDNFVWSAPAAGMRATLAPNGGATSEIRFTPEMTLEQFLGTDPKQFGFEKKPLIGTTSDDVMTTYAEWLPQPEKDSIYLYAPGIAGSKADSQLVFVHLDHDKVVGYSCSLDRSAEAALRTRAEQLFGKAHPDKERQQYQPVYVEFNGPPEAVVSVSEAEHDLISLRVGKDGGSP